MARTSEAQVVANSTSTTRWLQDGLTVRGGVEDPLAEGDPVAEGDAQRSGEAGTTGTGGQALATAATAATEDGEIGVVRGIGGIAPQEATIVMTAGGPATAKRLAEWLEVTGAASGHHPLARKMLAWLIDCNPCSRNK